MFGTELTPPSPLPAHPPMMGHASCRHTETVICGEPHRLDSGWRSLSTAGNGAEAGGRGSWGDGVGLAERQQWENLGMPSHCGVPLAKKLASLNHGEPLQAHSTHSWGGAKKRDGWLRFALPWWFETGPMGSAPSLKPRPPHLASCCCKRGWQLEKLGLGW